MSLMPHAYATIFPPLGEAELQDLATDIAENGLLEPLTIYEGAILDGRNRAAACEIADIEPATILYQGDDPLGFVISKNLRRRHLSTSQRAIIAAELSGELGQGKRTDLLGSNDLSRRAAATLLNVSEPSVKRAAALIEADPERAEAIKDGRLDETVSGALKEARKDSKKAKKNVLRLEAETKGREIPALAELRLGTFPEVLQDVGDNSVDLIFTDPPYDKESIPLYGELAKFAARVLKPGGSLMAYCGQYALPEIISLTTEHLRWWWLCGCYHEGGLHKSLPGINTYVLWKPIIWLVKGTNGSEEFVWDMIARPTPDKSQHDWSQSAIDARHYIEKLSLPGGLVIDPFAGAGTTLLVAKELGRAYLGSEQDPATELRARQALA